MKGSNLCEFLVSFSTQKTVLKERLIRMQWLVRSSRKLVMWTAQSVRKSSKGLNIFFITANGVAER